MVVRKRQAAVGLVVSKEEAIKTCLIFENYANCTLHATAAQQ
jgi:hypothetical protein